jgi:phospholipid-binding lipoprotein MlaA
MTKGAQNQLKHIACVLLLLAFSSVGCAHRQVATPSSTSSDASFNPSQEMTSSTSEQTPPDLEGVKEDFPDENFEFFLEEETEEEVVRVADPLSTWNRVMFHFNDKFYFWVLKPVARGYRAVVPRPVRSGVKNFFHNLITPIRMASCILQGKGNEASTEFARFMINSTVGVLGFGDPAKKWFKLDPSEEDLGQTLATYGIGDGFFIVWPILGPSTVRDSVGMIGDWFLNPVSYVQPIEAYLGVRAVETVNETSFRIGDYETLKEAAIEPYAAFRDAYIQYRKKKVEE